MNGRIAPIVNSDAGDSDVELMQVERLISGRPARRFHEREIIFHEGDRAGHLFILADGTAKLTRLRPDGSEALLCLLGPGSALGTCSLTGQHRQAFTAEAATACRVVYLPVQDLAAILRTNVGLADLVLNLQQNVTIELTWQVEHLTLLNNAQRLGAFLLRQMRSQTDGSEAELPCGKSVIAKLLGMPPASFSRALAKLRGIGVAVDGRRVRVASLDQLRAFCAAR